MQRARAYQTVASFIVLTTLVLAQAAALLLALNPASETLWYIDRAVFGLFGVGRHASLLSPTAFGLAVVVAALAIIAYRRRWLLLGGFISHLCLALAAIMFRTEILRSLVAHRRLQDAAFALLSRPGSLVLLIGLTAAIASALLSHLVYWRAIRLRAG